MLFMPGSVYVFNNCVVSYWDHDYDGIV